LLPWLDEDGNIYLYRDCSKYWHVHKWRLQSENTVHKDLGDVVPSAQIYVLFTCTYMPA